MSKAKAVSPKAVKAFTRVVKAPTKNAPGLLSVNGVLLPYIGKISPK